MPEFIQKTLDSMIIKWNDKFYFLIPVYDKKISNDINYILKKNNSDFFMIDIMKDTGNSLLSFEKKAFLLLALSIIIIFIILIIAYKNIIYTFCAILPGISGLLACLAVTVITGKILI